MSIRPSLLIALGALALPACGSEANKTWTSLRDSEFSVDTLTTTHNHPEYCVLSTDDARFSGEKLAHRLFDGKRFGSGAYHNFGAGVLFNPTRERIGYLPQGIFENGLSEEFVSMIYTNCGDESMGYRAAIIFTGPRFAKQTEEVFRYIPSSTRRLNNDYEGVHRTTKAGQVIEIPLTERNTTRALILTR